MKIKMFLIILVFPVLAIGQSKKTNEYENPQAPVDISEKPTGMPSGPPPVPAPLKVRDLRAASQWTITGNWSYIDLWIPSKLGFTVAYIRDPENTWEIDYMRGSLGLGWLGIDIGNFTDQRLGLIWRTYSARNSLNFQWGVNYNKTQIEVGSRLLSKISTVNTQYSGIELETLGLTWGIGNRWQTKGGFVWSVDWFQVHLPLMILKSKAPFIDATPDAQDKSDAEKVVSWITRIPRVTAIKVQLGMSF